MDLASFPPSRIIEVARLAFARPDTEFLCFGESDRSSPPAARDALVAAVDAGATTYPDVRGLPALRVGLARYLSGLHAQPVSEGRIQVTASGMAALNVAIAAVVRAGDRVVLHSPAWPNAGNAARLRGAQVDELALDALPDGRFSLDLNRLDTALAGARAFILNSPNNPTGWTATKETLAEILALCRRHHVWLISDEVYSRLVYDNGAAAPSLLDIATPEDRVIVCNSFSKLAPWLAGAAGRHTRWCGRTGRGDTFRRRPLHPARWPGGIGTTGFRAGLSRLLRQGAGADRNGARRAQRRALRVSRCRLLCLHRH
jgi:aspartate aminotransferase